jgi:hypothetical protein
VERVAAGAEAGGTKPPPGSKGRRMVVVGVGSPGGLNRKRIRIRTRPWSAAARTHAVTDARIERRGPRMRFGSASRSGIALRTFVVMVGKGSI